MSAASLTIISRWGPKFFSLSCTKAPGPDSASFTASSFTGCETARSDRSLCLCAAALSLYSSATVALKSPPLTPPASKNWSTLHCKSCILTLSLSTLPFLSNDAITFPSSSIVPRGLSDPFVFSIILPNVFTVISCLLISIRSDSSSLLVPNETWRFTVSGVILDTTAFAESTRLICLFLKSSSVDAKIIPGCMILTIKHDNTKSDTAFKNRPRLQYVRK